MHVVSALVFMHIEPAPVFEFFEPAPVVGCVAPALAVSHVASCDRRANTCTLSQCQWSTTSCASKSPGILIAEEKLESKMRRNSKSDAASSSQVRLQDAYFGRLMDTATVKLVTTKEESRDVDFAEPETWS